MSWEDLINSKKYIGGELEGKDSGYTYRGPITAIEINSKNIIFTFAWLAQLDGDGWRKIKDHHVWSVSIKNELRDIGNDRILFEIPYIGPYTIFPKNGSKLDRAKVKGL